MEKTYLQSHRRRICGRVPCSHIGHGRRKERSCSDPTNHTSVRSALNWVLAISYLRLIRTLTYRYRKSSRRRRYNGTFPPHLCRRCSLSHSDRVHNCILSLVRLLEIRKNKQLRILELLVNHSTRQLGAYPEQARGIILTYIVRSQRARENYIARRKKHVKRRLIY